MLANVTSKNFSTDSRKQNPCQPCMNKINYDDAYGRGDTNNDKL